MTRTNERKQWLDDVFVTALEGGIGYWSECSEYRWFGPDGEDPTDKFRAVIFDIADAPEPTRYVIDVSVITRGLALVTSGKCKGVSGEWVGQLMLADRTNGEDGDIDADGADAVVQAGLFGEVVYG